MKKISGKALRVAISIFIICVIFLGKPVKTPAQDIKLIIRGDDMGREEETVICFSFSMVK